MPENPEKTELQVKQEEFIKEYGVLVEKHGMDFASYPVWTPDGSGGFKMLVQNTVVDVKNQPKPSPFVAEEK